MIVQPTTQKPSSKSKRQESIAMGPTREYSTKAPLFCELQNSEKGKIITSL